MKIIPAFAVGLFQTLAVLHQVMASGLFVEFNQDLVADMHALKGQVKFLSSEALPAEQRLIGELREGEDPYADAMLLAMDGNSTEIIGALRPGEVVDDLGLVNATLLSDGLPIKHYKMANSEGYWTRSTLGDATAAGRRLLADIQPAPPNPAKCTDTTPPTGPNCNVVIAVSSCFTDFGWDLILGWVDRLKAEEYRYFEGGAASDINYVIQVVDDGCDACSPGKPNLVTNGPPPVAVISIMVYTKGFITINNWKSAQGFPLIGFVAYEPPQSVTVLPGYLTLMHTADDTSFLTPYDPWTVARGLHCKNFPGAIPTTYIDNAGHRQCFCSCPSGYVERNGKCVADPDPACNCAWDVPAIGFKFEVKIGEESKYQTGTGQCLIKNLATPALNNLLPVPIPIDNYVDHLRVNDGDSNNPLVLASPHIELQKKKVTYSVKQGVTAPAQTEQGDTNGVTQAYTWKDFQSNSAAKVNQVSFDHVGRYNVELKAQDYSSNQATCDGCVLVIDSRRPTPSSSYTCPTDCDDAVTDLTKTKIGNIQRGLSAVKAFKDNAVNDPCSPNVRCDDDSLKLKRFTDPAYQSTSSSLDTIGTLFELGAVKTDLTNRLTGYPFDFTKPNGIATSVSQTSACTRCAAVSTKLREWWTPYTCGTTSATSVCDGYSDAKCSREQCISVTGDTLASATATLKPAVVSNSKTVVRALNNDAGKSDLELIGKYSLNTKIHIALQCSKFPSLLASDEEVQITPDVCTYSSKLSDLIDVDTSRDVSNLLDALFTDAELDSFASWRYKIDSGAWKAWGSTSTETFSKTETYITVEAWTQCGKIQTFTFIVVLHLNNEIKVCERFDDMWYQTTNAPLRGTPGKFCLYDKSDFAELTFDYHPNIGLNFDVDKFQMSISRVVCSLNYKDRSPVTILDSNAFTPKTFEIVKQLAIDGLDVATTKAETKVQVSCDFTYSRQPDSNVVIQSCTQQFTIVDCTPPQINKPCELDGKCNFNQCAAAGTSETKKDLFQACGGTRIFQDTSSGQTTLSTTQVGCCDSCDTRFFTTQCVPIEAFPTGSTTQFGYIKRCEAVPKQNSMMLAAAKAYDATSNSMALLGASAMIAVVALVVVQRRRRATDKAMMEDDAYYPLMN